MPLYIVNVDTGIRLKEFDPITPLGAVVEMEKDVAAPLIENGRLISESEANRLSRSAHAKEDGDRYLGIFSEHAKNVKAAAKAAKEAETPEEAPVVETPVVDPEFVAREAAPEPAPDQNVPPVRTRAKKK
jgi:hypothetical protein